MTLKKPALIAFFLWHAFSVAVYSVPRESKDPFGQWMQLDLLPHVSPYMLLTSQWQLWNLFSPDPQRRVTFYAVEAWEGSQWREITTVQPGTFSIWRHATRFKMMSNMLDEFANNRAPFAGRYMHLLCAEHGLLPQTTVRLQYTYYVIPYHERRESRAWWNAWSPEVSTYTGFQTVCPTAP